MISDSEQYDDCSQGESDSDYNHDSEEEASVMDLSSDDELTTEKDEEKDEESEVAQAKTSDSINSLVAQEVLQIIKDGDESKKLTLDNCRSYLRHHGMRISGNKPVLIDRIKQHMELKQGPLEKYRPATFTINCTGDVCKGDVVKFKRKVYKAGKPRKGAEAIGEHLVVGRVVKESYGEKKQQHTFTVEVLWSAGYKPLPPMRQLLVKGRNLYKLRTYRQKWEDESLRKTSLDEKHERGAAARSIRRDKLKASGRPKAATGTQKQLPNPYVAMGVSGNPQPHLLGERGNAGRGEPSQQGSFPKVPMVHEQRYFPPRKETVPRHTYSNSSRVDSHQPHVHAPVILPGQRDARLKNNIPSGLDEYEHHNNPPAGVAGRRYVEPKNTTPSEVGRRIDGYQQHNNPRAGVADRRDIGPNYNIPSDVARRVDGYQHHSNPPAGVAGRSDSRLHHSNHSGLGRGVYGYYYYDGPPVGVGGRRDDNPSLVERRGDGFHHYNGPPVGAGRRDAGLIHSNTSVGKRRFDGYHHHNCPPSGGGGLNHNNPSLVERRVDGFHQYTTAHVGLKENVPIGLQFPQPLQPPKRTQVSCPTAGCKNYGSKVCTYGDHISGLNCLA
ncbi:hypothetical protein AXG93_1275s1280 [Marchantia polymorpha subsp. ruderalis]|uniref:SAP domain-containing protein n=1 Tax=Marchantia polymorpha subsp. ruderalis TaxID=1480154 RepID=A0A176VM82_MARPO|nr:hypothetical protein AXG93_1275s1280 [Marchantia polymorpha subsp. ruderalis]